MPTHKLLMVIRGSRSRLNPPTARGFTVGSGFGTTYGINFHVEAHDGNGTLVASFDNTLLAGAYGSMPMTYSTTPAANPITVLVTGYNAIDGTETIFSGSGNDPCLPEPVDPVVLTDQPLCDDGRINSGDCAGPVALYCDDTLLNVYGIDPETGDGWL